MFIPSFGEGGISGSRWRGERIGRGRGRKRRRQEMGRKGERREAGMEWEKDGKEKGGGGRR